VSLNAQLQNCLLLAEAIGEWWPLVQALEKKDVEPSPASSVTTSWVCVMTQALDHGYV